MSARRMERQPLGQQAMHLSCGLWRGQIIAQRSPHILTIETGSVRFGGFDLRERSMRAVLAPTMCISLLLRVTPFDECDSSSCRHKHECRRSAHAQMHAATQDQKKATSTCSMPLGSKVEAGCSRIGKADTRAQPRTRNDHSQHRRVAASCLVHSTLMSVMDLFPRPMRAHTAPPDSRLQQVARGCSDLLQWQRRLAEAQQRRCSGCRRCSMPRQPRSPGRTQ
jgi:hypothetical protein